jgi:hypothetical protein
MRSDSGAHHSTAEEFETVWAARRTTATVGLGLPGIIVSAGLTGFLATMFFDVSAAMAIAVTVAVIVVALRVFAWTQLVARRAVAVSDTHLAVRRGAKILNQMPWTDIASVRLIPGNSRLRMMFDIFSDDADFPYILARPTDVWDVRGPFPPLLAVLPAELQRLESALEEACAARSVPFSVGDHD